MAPQSIPASMAACQTTRGHAVESGDESLNSKSRRLVCVLVASWIIGLLSCALVSAQQDPAIDSQNEPEPIADESNTAPRVPTKIERPTVWDLTLQGGIFMIPIFGCSIVVVAFTIERFIGLRRKKIIPPKLLAGLDQQTSQSSGLDPRVAYRLCQQHPSPMAQILRAGLLKVGRPHAEVEKAVEDAGAREVGALFRNIRPLNLCASVGPLLGLIGTVQGMIMAFIVTSTTTATGTAKAQELAHGIYTALVTTFAGLCVAIPAVSFAHYFEGWIERVVREIEEIMLEILPHLERFEGKSRVVRSKGRDTSASDETAVKAQSSLSSARGTGKPEVAAVPTVGE
jgi:biopolymer transport protein ExbB